MLLNKNKGKKGEHKTYMGHFMHLSYENWSIQKIFSFNLVVLGKKVKMLDRDQVLVISSERYLYLWRPLWCFCCCDMGGPGEIFVK